MEFLTISEVARQAGVQASAIRYYESRKILPVPTRVGGQRRYGVDAVYRLAVIRRAQDAGFSLEEIQHLFFGFRDGTPVSARWQRLAEVKLAELDQQVERIQSMKELLERLRTRCRCNTVSECGAAMLRRASTAPRA
jgi:DNA-binding transcriptional MerR regulator